MVDILEPSNGQKLPDIEPGLEGTVIGGVRAVMRDLGLGHMAPVRFYDALKRAGLEVKRVG